MMDVRCSPVKFISQCLPFSSCLPIYRNHYQRNVPYIPPEILTDLLSRLPVKSLMRFRCVSKSWCALIDSQEFSKIHLNQSLESSTNFSIILVDKSLYSIHLDEVGTRSAETETVKLDQPFNPNAFDTFIVGSCNGVLCLLIGEPPQKFSFVIWNPSMQKYRQLTLHEDYFRLPEGQEVEEVRVFLGFGYDAVGDEYKLFSIVEVYDIDDMSIGSEVMVYGTKSDTWRQLYSDNFPYSLNEIPHFGVLVNGALHWPVREKQEPINNNLLIAAFDIGTETCRVVPQPKYEDHNSKIIDVQIFEGYLALMCKSNSKSSDQIDISQYSPERFDIRVMKEYGVTDSWTKLISIPYSSRLSDIMPIPYLNVREHDVLFMQLCDIPQVLDGHGSSGIYYILNYGFVWLGTEKKSGNNVQIRNVPKFEQAYMSVESLTQLPDSGRCDGLRKA